MFINQKNIAVKSHIEKDYILNGVRTTAHVMQICLEGQSCSVKKR